MTYEQQVESLRRELLKQKIRVEDLAEYKESLFEPLSRLLTKEKNDYTREDYVDFLYLCLDYYTYTDDVLISDYDYDMVMHCFVEKGGVPMTTADALAQNTEWDLVKHEEPGVVGSIKKVYTEEEFLAYYKSHFSDMYIIAPKYDGISASVKLDENGKIIRALTRYDGVYGQDITKVVRGARNSYDFYEEIPLARHEGYYKVELCVSVDDFYKLNQQRELLGLKPYSNRRSATSGIINTPKNLQFARYVTIIPLGMFDGVRFCYAPEKLRTLDDVGSFDYLFTQVKDVINECHRSDFPFRTDGCVILPCGINVASMLDQNDFMSHGIAFKINTKIGRTTVKKLYISVGRLGKAVPMANVYPVEVNETIVNDVSLGSIDKAIQMDIHEDEIVEVYSAGDVIPQLRLPEERDYPKHAKKMHIDLSCPYCGNDLTIVGKEMFCTNQKCPRIITGRIANFLQKIGVENISDATIENLYNNNLIVSIPDMFELEEKDIQKLDKYGELSAKNIVDELNRIRKTPIDMDVFFGALGFDGIGQKTMRKILNHFSVDTLLSQAEKMFEKSEDVNCEEQFSPLRADISKFIVTLSGVDDIGEKTASSLLEGLINNFDEIKELMEVLNLKQPSVWKGSVCFTGFRDYVFEKRINSLGYEVTDNLTKNTMLLICATNDFSSAKCVKARKYQIPIITREEAEEKYKKGKLKIKKMYKEFRNED